jgi:hypothetical protein
MVARGNGGGNEPVTETDNYRGVSFSIPHNDDGVWHYKIHPSRNRTANRPRPLLAPTEGFTTREAAVAAAHLAIDSWMRRESN